jgi:hypothetical protein
VRFRVEAGAGVLVMDFDGLKRFVDAVKRRSPDLRLRVWRPIGEVRFPGP